MAFVMVFSIFSIACGGEKKTDTSSVNESSSEGSSFEESSSEDTTAEDISSEENVASSSSNSVSKASSKVTSKASSTKTPSTAATSSKVTLPDATLNGVGKFWLMPRNDQIYNIFTNLNQWTELQKIVDVVGFADHEINRLTGGQLEDAFEGMRKAGIPLALEVGAIKEWGMAEGGKGVYGKAMFDTEDLMWSKFVELGADFRAVAFDEPYINVMKIGNWDYLGNGTKKFEFAVEQTAEYIKLIRAKYPKLLIGDIETYPSMSPAENIKWITELNARLKAKGVKTLDFYRLDFDWNHIAVEDKNGVVNETTASYHWGKVKEIEDHCKSIGLPFSMVYWPAQESLFKPAQSDEYNDKAWYDMLMRQGAEYKKYGGNPDQYVVQTWAKIGTAKKPMPPTTIPETKKYSFMNGSLEFYKQFVKK